MIDTVVLSATIYGVINNGIINNEEESNRRGYRLCEVKSINWQKRGRERHGHVLIDRRDEIQTLCTLEVVRVSGEEKKEKKKE